MINYDILIDMKKSGCIDTGYELSQGDKELVEFNVILKNGSVEYVPEGDATIVFKKANNQTESGALIPVGNTYNYKIKGSELSVPGPVLAEIKTYDEETGRATSSRFKFWVKADLANYDTTETGTYIGELEHKIIEANALIDQITLAKDQAVQLLTDLSTDNFAQSYEINDPLKIPSSAVTYALGQDKIDKSKIINTLAVTEEGFLADALLVKDLQDQINEQNNKLTKTSGTLSLASNVASAYSIIKKSNNRVFINISLTVSTSGSDINLGTLSTGFRPTVNPVFGTCGVYRSGSCVAVQGIYIGTDGTLQIKTTTAFTSGDSIRASIAFDID